VPRIRITPPQKKKIFNRPPGKPKPTTKKNKKKTGTGRAGTGTGASTSTGGERSKNVTTRERDFFNAVIVVGHMKQEANKPRKVLYKDWLQHLFTTRPTVSGTKQHCMM